MCKNIIIGTIWLEIAHICSCCLCVMTRQSRLDIASKYTQHLVDAPIWFPSFLSIASTNLLYALSSKIPLWSWCTGTKSLFSFQASFTGTLVWPDVYLVISCEQILRLVWIIYRTPTCLFRNTVEDHELEFQIQSSIYRNWRAKLKRQSRPWENFYGKGLAWQRERILYGRIL